MNCEIYNYIQKENKFKYNYNNNDKYMSKENYNFNYNKNEFLNADNDNKELNENFNSNNNIINMNIKNIQNNEKITNNKNNKQNIYHNKLNNSSLHRNYLTLDSNNLQTSNSNININNKFNNFNINNKSSINSISSLPYQDLKTPLRNEFKKETRNNIDDAFKINSYTPNRDYNSNNINDINLYNNFKINLKKPIHKLKFHKGNALCLSVLNDGRLVSGSSDTNIIVYNKITYQPDIIIKEHTNSARGIITLSSGELASCSDDKTIKLFIIKANNYQIL